MISMSLRERLESAIGPCVIPGGAKLHLKLILAEVQRVKGA